MNLKLNSFICFQVDDIKILRKKNHTIVTETVSDGSVRGARDRNCPHQDL